MPVIASLALVALSLAQAPIHVPFHLAEDAIVVDATVNGRPVSLLFDTGFGGAVVLDSAINVGTPTGKMTLRDFVGEMEASTIKIKSLSIGQRSVVPTDLEVVQQPFAGMSEGYNVHIDGILGLEAMKDGPFEINFQRKEFVFYPASMDISARKPDDKKTFLAKMLPIGTRSIELEVATKAGKKMVMALDTGNAFYATSHKDVLERVGLWDSSAKPKYMGLSGVASGPVDSFYKALHDMTIFGVPVSRSVWSIIDLPSGDAEGDGTIGFGFLQNFNITVDYDRRRVWFENFTGKVGSEDEANVGISGRSNSKTKRVEILRVAPDSPADKAGIREGDQILSIDGTDVGMATFRKLEKMLSGPSGTTLRLVLSRNGAIVRSELTRVPLVND